MDGHRKGLLLKRKDFLGVDEEAGSHPNRTYYFKKNADMDNIIATCTKSLRSDPNSKNALLLRGRTLLKMQHYKEAAEDFSRLIDLDPSHIETYYNRGMAYSKFGLQDRAISDFSRVLSHNPDHVNSLFARAACYNTVGQFSAAIEDYNIALLKDQDRSSSSGSNIGGGSSVGGYVSGVYMSGGASPDKRSPSSGMGYGSVGGMAGTPISTHSYGTNKHGEDSPRDGVGYTPASPGSVRSSYRSTPPASHPSHTLRADEVRSEVMNDTRRVHTHDHAHQHNSTARQQQQQHDDSTAGSTSGSHIQAEEYHRRGFDLRRQGHFQQAIMEYTKALDLHPRHFKALFNRAFAYDKIGQPTDAISDYTAALTIEPTNAFAYYNRGISYDSQGQYSQALHDFQQASSLHTENVDFRHNLALCYRKLGDFETAVTVYGACLELDPKHLKSLHGRGGCYEKLQLYEQAIADYRTVLRARPEHIACLISVGQLLLQTRKDDPRELREASKVLSSAISILCPDGEYKAVVLELIHMVSTNSGVTMHRQDVLDAQRKVCDVVTALHSRSKVHAELGNGHLAVNDVSVCLSLLAIMDDTKVSTGPRSAGNIAGSEAETTLISHMRTLPGNTSLPALYDVYSSRGMYYKSMGAHEKATSDFQSCIFALQGEISKLNSSSSSAATTASTLTAALVEGYNHVGFCLRKTDSYASAIDAYSQAVQLAPDAIRGYNNRAYCYAKCEYYEQAVADYSAVIKLDPQNSHAYHNRGISLDKLGLFDKAIEDFAKVIELDASNDSIPSTGPPRSASIDNGNYGMPSGDNGQPIGKSDHPVQRPDGAGGGVVGNTGDMARRNGTGGNIRSAGPETHIHRSHRDSQHRVSTGSPTNGSSIGSGGHRSSAGHPLYTHMRGEVHSEEDMSRGILKGDSYHGEGHSQRRIEGKRNEVKGDPYTSLSTTRRAYTPIRSSAHLRNDTSHLPPPPPPHTSLADGRPVGLEEAARRLGSFSAVRSNSGSISLEERTTTSLGSRNNHTPASGPGNRSRRGGEGGSGKRISASLSTDGSVATAPHNTSTENMSKVDRRSLLGSSTATAIVSPAKGGERKGGSLGYSHSSPAAATSTTVTGGVRQSRPVVPSLHLQRFGK